MIVSVNDLEGIRRQHSSQRIALGTGCFDLLHPGHWEHLDHIASLGEIVVVAVLGDLRVKELKGQERPFQPELSRARMIDGHRRVDYTLVEPYSDDRSSMLGGQGIIPLLRPDIFVVDETWKRYHEQIRGLGTEIHEYDIDSVKVDSTTAIAQRIMGTFSPYMLPNIQES